MPHGWSTAVVHDDFDRLGRGGRFATRIRVNLQRVGAVRKGTGVPSEADVADSGYRDPLPVNPEFRPPRRGDLRGDGDGAVYRRSIGGIVYYNLRTCRSGH